MQETHSTETLGKLIELAKPEVKSNPSIQVPSAEVEIASSVGREIDPKNYQGLIFPRSYSLDQIKVLGEYIARYGQEKTVMETLSKVMHLIQVNNIRDKIRTGVFDSSVEEVNGLLAKLLGGAEKQPKKELIDCQIYEFQNSKFRCVSCSQPGARHSFKLRKTSGGYYEMLLRRLARVYELFPLV